MKAKEAIAEIRKRLEARRDEYLSNAKSLRGAPGRMGRDYQAISSYERLSASMSEALVIVGEVERLMS